VDCRSNLVLEHWLRHAGAVEHEEGVVEYLLAPRLPDELLYQPICDAVRLAVLYRLRRNHPYSVASIDPERVRTAEATDAEYLKSLRLLDPVVTGGDSLLEIAYGDLSPLLPYGEHEFILLMRSPPVGGIPCWPRLVVELDAVLVSQVDEYMQVQTANPSVRKLLDSLRE
jgi:hypothetical protein